jgi:hypothetical protein
MILAASSRLLDGFLPSGCLLHRVTITSAARSGLDGRNVDLDSRHPGNHMGFDFSATCLNPSDRVWA